MNNLKLLRLEKGMNMKEAADFLDLAYTTYVSYEKGDREPNSDILCKIADKYNSTTDYILCVENAPRHPSISGSDTPGSPKGVRIPVLGYVRAGVPITAVENIIDYEEISVEMSRHGEYFALKIKGDSMEPKISDGDVVIVRKQETVENGEVAVVLVNGDEATVKKFYKLDNGVHLISTNTRYDPFFYTPDEVNTLPVSVIGKVVELRAKF